MLQLLLQIIATGSIESQVYVSMLDGTEAFGNRYELRRVGAAECAQMSQEFLFSGSAPNALSAKLLERNATDILIPKGVSGKVMLHERPGMVKLFHQIYDMPAPDQERLARTLVVQEKSMQHCCRLGVSIIHLSIPHCRAP